MTGAAFFDFDNTVIHGDVGPLFGQYLVQSRYQHIKETQGRRAADKDRRRLLARYTPYITWMGIQAALYKTRAVRRSSLIRSAYKALKGIRSEHYYGLMDEFVDEEVPDRIYPEIHAAMQRHTKAGRKCVIITTGVQALVERAVRHLPEGVEVIGCTLHEEDGRLTGTVDGPLYGADKANILAAYCRAGGLSAKQSYAYSDHYSDYHMLEAVGHPVCINPRGRLEKMAQEHGWDVLRLSDPRDRDAQ